jgi:hypothetical protein
VRGEHLDDLDGEPIVKPGHERFCLGEAND